MRVLITGVHGFVGSNLVEALKSEHTIYGLDIISPEKDGVVKTFSWEDLDNVGSGFLDEPCGKAERKVKGSSTSEAAKSSASHEIPEVDAIIHLAGKAHDTKNKSAADVYFKVNTGLTQKIFDWFLKQPKCKKFVFFSTAKAAADRVEGLLTEDVVPTPVGPYGESKIAAERYILSHAETTESTDIDCLNTNFHELLVNFQKNDSKTDKRVYIFRPCMIHGPGNKGNLNLLYNVVKKGIPYPLGAFENERTFTSIGNICFAVEGVLTKEVPSGIYNMGDDEALSTNELIEEICKSLGKKTHIWKLPKSLMIKLASLGGKLHLPLNPERLQKLTESYVSSNAKIKKVLGVEKMPVDAREGLKVTLESFK